MSRKSFARIVLLICVYSGGAAGDEGDGPRPPMRELDHFPADVLTDGFIAAHPDLFHRKAGLADDERGYHEKARRHYQRAAYYADKPSQARLGEMFWHGEGGETDRAMGFLWMALAAERGYSMFKRMSEQYWSELTYSEKQKAIEHDQHLLGRYGDAVAKRRLEVELKRYLLGVTGSRLGYQGQFMNVDVGGRLVEPERYFAPEFWEPEAYWRLQEKMWSDPPTGRVEASELQPVKAPQEN